MEGGALPWEASRDLLALHRHLVTTSGDDNIEIPVRFARWYWRACLAMPDAKIDERIRVAAHPAIWEATGKPRSLNSTGIRTRKDDAEALHWFLVYSQWRSPEDKKAYEEAIESAAVERFYAPGQGLSAPIHVGSWPSAKAEALVELALGYVRPRRKEGKGR